MIQEDTKASIRDKPLSYRQALLRFIYSTMAAGEFASAFWDDEKNEWSATAGAIADAFEAELPEPPPYELPADHAVRLHEAICEGRRQDAIDALNDIAGDNYRSVAEQHSLFPGRVPA